MAPTTAIAPIPFERSTALPVLRAVARPAGAAAATAFPDATDAALAILRAGGTAADAAAAAAWAIAVCEPSGSGIGGQTSVLLRRTDGRFFVIDGHSMAPHAASLRRISAHEQHEGRKATTIPSTVAVLDVLRASFGRLSAAEVMAPAIELATRGHAFTKLQRREVRWCWDSLEANGSHHPFLNERGRLLSVGKPLRQPALARTLERLVRHGAEDFYQGGIAGEIARDMAESGGLVTADDLKALKIAVTDRAVEASVNGHRVVTMPPPGGGVTLLQTLRLLERLSDGGSPEPEFLAAAAEAIFAAFRFRERWPLSADEFTPALEEWMLGDAQIAEMAETARKGGRVVPETRRGDPSGDTSHLCIADAEGNVVSLTQSIQSLFGAKVAHPTLGFFYNNYLTTALRHRHPQRLGPRSTPRSNVSPVIVVDPSGAFRLAAGAAGSRRIVSSVAQTVHRVIARGESLAEAVGAPRIHALLNGKVWIEEPGLTPQLSTSLAARWRSVITRRQHHYKMACVQALGCDRAGRVEAVADPRRDGAAATLEDGS